MSESDDAQQAFTWFVVVAVRALLSVRELVISVQPRPLEVMVQV